jgi:uncharacterized protein
MSTPSIASPPALGWSKSTSPYHPGEQWVQERAGAREFAERIGRQVIRDYMTDQHREFYAMLPFIFVGTLDQDKRPWASILCGQPGFVHSPDPARLVVHARAPRGDPLAQNLRPGAPIALVGVQFETRRRNRVNGWISQATEGGFDLNVGQSFGNCPQYIQARDPRFARGLAEAAQGRPEFEGAVLSRCATDLIGNADTFFVASASPNAGTSNPVEGVDVNHRGGRPGFVRVRQEQGQSVITWPDFVGNSAFNTLGNIVLNPVAGLLFVDYCSGDVLSLTGTAEVVWDDPDAAGLRGAERLVRLRVDRGVYIADAIPMRWSEPQYASQLAGTGTWVEAEQSHQAGEAANRYRSFVVQRIDDESSTVRSFCLAPDDAEGLAPHQSGQFLPIAVRLSADSPELRRTYTISNQPGEGMYRLSIKRETRRDGTAGLVSNWFHDRVEVGTRVQAMAPRGDFVLDTQSKRPVVLISAGVGVTPMIAMVDFLTSAYTERPRFPDRRAWFLHFVKNSREHAFGAHIRSLAEHRPNLVTHVRYSEPLSRDVLGADFHSIGLIDAALLKQLLPLDDYDFCLCGPQAFMQRAYDILLDLGARDEHIRFESFGPASIERRPERIASLPGLSPPTEHAVIRFERSGRQIDWAPSMGSVLDAAEAAGLSLPWSCRSGSCGTCRVDVVSGQATYAVRPAASIDPKSALLCCALPATPALVVDA